MTTWTPAAESFFRDFLAAQFGARPADEMAQDLRCHVHEELAQRGIFKVTRIELQQVIGQLSPDKEFIDRPADETTHQEPPSNHSSRLKMTMASIFYVVLPFAVVLLEAMFHWCADVFFNPVPTPIHILLLLMVPGTTGWLLWKNGPWTPRELQVAACLSGISLATSIYYMALTFWWIPMAVLGVIVFGLGLLPLAPMFALIGVQRVRGLTWKQLTSAQEIPWQQWSRRGIMLGLATLAVLELPSYVGRIGLTMATSANVVVRERGLNLIRIASYDEGVLRRCYDSGRSYSGNGDAANMVVEFFGGKIRHDKAQEIYFLLTGTPYTEVAPPLLHSRLLESQNREFTFDPDQGGDRVGARLRGLFLDTSRLDTHIDANARLSYTEWTIEFENQTLDTHEARCQVQLPPEAVVSRVTLWVHGEPEEAAFGPNNKVKQAYKSVVLQERRDPVLVTVSGPDQVLVQCFPVLPRGKMKVRLGITAPWSEIDPTVILPKIVERNFGYADSFAHCIWSQGAGQAHGKQVTLTNAELLHQGAVAVAATEMFDNGNLPTQVWSRDPFAAELSESVIVGTRSVNAVPAMDKVLFVLDGSTSMKPFINKLTEQLSALPQDKVDYIIATSSAAPGFLHGADALAHWVPRGGVDNMPALCQAARLLLEQKSAAIVWVHGPQPLHRSVQFVAQAMERQPGLRIYDVPMTPGVNAIPEGLRQAAGFCSGPCQGERFHHDFASFLDELIHGTTHDVWTIQRQAANAPVPIGAIEVNDQFSRHTRYREFLTAWRQPDFDTEHWAKELARYQLVTPISGAVVLEKQEQYEQHGLKQVAGKTVPHMPPAIPSVPEPSSALLVLLGLLTTCSRRRR